MSFNLRKLRGRIVEIFGTQQAFSAAMGWSERTCSLKLNGLSIWDQAEIAKAIELLKLTIDDIPIYFFTVEVKELEPVSA